MQDKYKIERAYLFGSYALGYATSDSDIHIALISSSSFSGNQFYDNVKLGTLTWGIDTRVEPICFTPEDFDDNILTEEIKKTGIEIPTD
ncbi:MAG: nucleotidyltransferase domain-containing protein [Bacteroidetes bacterium]|nr:nucleotidyltransferase domain-containing protein [Bacteroidota bacterium]MBU2584767.1 nucleotidyltransferase domain-containing protein [Bacteroidota bacterium]